MPSTTTAPATVEQGAPALWTFVHDGMLFEFGPYRTEDESKHAFQRHLGYWPADPVEVIAWQPR